MVYQRPGPPKIPAKRGRPLLGSVALTPAERQRKSRAAKKYGLERPERAALLKAIRKRIKDSEHGNIAAMRRALAMFQAALDGITIEQLREIARTYKTVHDRKGRNSREAHTGGKNVEAIAGAHERDEHGHKPKLGPSPDVDLDPIDNYTPSELRGDSNPNLSEKRGGGLIFPDMTPTVWDRIPTIAEKMFTGEERDPLAEFDPNGVDASTLCCRVCGLGVASWVDARAHVDDILKTLQAEEQAILAQSKRAEFAEWSIINRGLERGTDAEEALVVDLKKGLEAMKARYVLGAAYAHKAGIS